jgi:transcriptional regulator with XRE-family HTH domain
MDRAPYSPSGPRKVLRQGEVERSIAARLKTFRDARGMSIRVLGDLLHEKGRTIDPSGVTKIEQGQRRITVDDLVALMEIFDVSFEEITKPASCSACMDVPPMGFTCNGCGKAGKAPDDWQGDKP